jgi:hypothetical protein
MKTVWQHCEFDEVRTLERLEREMHRTDERLKRYRVEVPSKWRNCVVPDYYFPGECFPRAIYFVRTSSHLAEALYVLGEAACGGLGQHGWVEIGDVVFDGVLQEFYAKAGYYESEHARPWYRFTRPATMWIDQMGRGWNTLKDHWTYRWDGLLGLPWADYSNPALIDLDAARRYWHQERKKQCARKR